MKLSLAWLKEYVAVRLTAQQVAERLTLAGLEVSGRRVVGDDVLFECEVTPNRPDWLSHVGVARELAALTGARLTLPPAAGLKPAPGHRPTITVQDRKTCRRYVGTLVEGVAVGPSPAWLKQKVEAMGARSINNVVDVTNVVLCELGQPLHCFDADRLAGGRIVVRRATPGETMITIDGLQRSLDPSILVIADAKRPVAVAGIMGGQATEVTGATRRVLLESAWFDPVVTRRAARTLGLASESSYRFERGVDLEQVAAAARRAVALIVEVAGGHVVGGPVDRRTTWTKSKPVAWQPAQASALGVAIPVAKQRQVLERLGCRVAGTGTWWRVTPPSFRSDLKQPVDLLEELARLWGYERIPVTLPRPVPPASALAPETSVDLRLRERQLRELLVASGLDEMLTYSVISPDGLARIRWGGGEPIPLRNPLSRDHSMLRPTLLIGALETVARNLNRRMPGVALFELGRTYHWATGGPPQERRTLALALAGLRPSSWDATPAPWTLFHATGILEAIAQRVGAPPMDWRPAEERWSVAGTAVQAPGGSAGVVDPAIAEAFEIPRHIEVIVAEVAWLQAFGAVTRPVSVRPVPKVAPVTRDLAILVDEPVAHAQIAAAILAAGAPLAQSAILFDSYRGPQVPQGKKGLAYTVTYSAGDRALTDEEAAAAHTAIVQHLQTQIGATLR